MAERAGMTPEHLDGYLSSVSAELAWLPEWEELWPDEPEDNRVTYHLEWDNLMGAVAALEQAEHAGLLTDEQRERYRALLDRLREVMPIIERLNLTRPPVLVGR